MAGRVHKDVIHQALNLAKGSQPWMGLSKPSQALPDPHSSGDLSAQQRLRWVPEAHPINKCLLSVSQAGSGH